MPSLPAYQRNLRSFLDRLKRLEEALAVPSPSPLEQEGILRRFAFAAESGWKTIRAYLEAVGEAPENPTPPTVLAAAWRRRMLFNGQNWMDMLVCRSELSRSDSPEALRRAMPEVRDRFFPELARLRSWLLRRFPTEESCPDGKKKDVTP